ncbi:MAG TPA: fructosamine kinase family protein, partial [Capsulimonadaceae bacterium]|nr:fructosamine kinase family protein [Capsulimonadaceae bacterium]
MDETIKAALEKKLGTKVVSSTTLSGGMVNTAARVETTDGPIFVKWKGDTPARFFEMEADGLSRLGAANALLIPPVVAFQDRQEGDEPAFLALEWIEEGRPVSSERFKQNFAEGLAALHRNNPSPFGQFGLEYDNYLGAQPQKNTPSASWA